MKQMLETIMLRLTDRLIEAALSGSRGNYVPKPDPPLGQPLETPLIVEQLQVGANHYAQQSPELVGRVRIIALRRERGVAGQAAEQEESSIASGDRRQTDFDAQE